MAGRKSDFTLTKLDDLFTTQAQRDEEQLSKIRDIPLELIDDFPDHPFKVRDDEDMMQLVESVKERGVITPATVRQKEDGRYTQYPAHVLRYYPYGRAFTAGGNQAIVEVALTQLGNQGGQPYWSWYGFNSRVEWCACFVSWCADQCGYIESGLVPKFAGCVDGANWFKSNGKWQDRTYEPKAGDIIFFDWEGDGTTDHVGIVEKCENGTVYTVEGNSGDACKQRQYTVGSSNIYGYGIPAY